MKFYIAAIITSLFMHVSGYSQSNALPVDEKTQLITYQEVVTEEGNKEVFYIRAVEWINQYYKNPMDVTKTRQAESGLIKGVHRFRIENTNEDGSKTDAGTIQYDFTLDFKEGRYRYTLTEFALRQSSKVPVEKWLNDSDPQKQSYLKQIDDFAQSWIESLKEGMKPKAEVKEEEW
jgi:hypothetical protein